MWSTAPKLAQSLPLRIGAAVVMAIALCGGVPRPAHADTPDGPPGGDGGGQNIVKVVNRDDHRLRARGEVQLNRIPGPTAEPVNLALGQSSCTDCQTFAVALQIDLVSRTARTIAPQNAAVAVNERCTRCYTVARAIQYVIQVDDPTRVPDHIRQLIGEMDHALDAIQSDHDITMAEAQRRIDAVVARFQQLAGSLRDQRQEARDDNSPGWPRWPGPPLAAGG